MFFITIFYSLFNDTPKNTLYFNCGLTAAYGTFYWHEGAEWVMAGAKRDPHTYRAGVNFNTSTAFVN